MSLTAGCSREIFPGLSDTNAEPPSTSASLPPTAKDPAETAGRSLATPKDLVPARVADWWYTEFVLLVTLARMFPPSDPDQRAIPRNGLGTSNGSSSISMDDKSDRTSSKVVSSYSVRSKLRFTDRTVSQRDLVRFLDTSTCCGK